MTFNCGASPVTVTSTKTISADTTIDGDGSLITISGGHSVLVFAANTGVTFTVQNLTVANGKGTGGSSGGIANDVGGTLTVTNSTFSSNSTDPGYGGGGIANFASGTLPVTNSTFASNSAAAGAIENDSTLTVTNSTQTTAPASLTTQRLQRSGTRLSSTARAKIATGRSPMAGTTSMTARAVASPRRMAR